MPYYPPATGGGSVPGSNTQIIFNDNGALGADAGLAYDKTMQLLAIGTAANTIGIISTGNGDAGHLNAAALSFQPGMPFDDGSTPADAGTANFNGSVGVNGGHGTGYSFTGGNSDTGLAGGLKFRSGNSAGPVGGGGNIGFELGTDSNGLPGEYSISGLTTVDQQDQDSIFNDNGVLTFSGSAGAFAASARMNYVLWYPIPGSTTPSMIGSTITTSGLTWSSLTPTSATDAATRQQRARGSTAASAGATGVFTTAGVAAYTGAGPGSYHEFLTGVGTNLTGHQCFVGASGSATSLAGDPSALTNVIGIGFNAADLSTGNWWFYCNDGSGTATKIDTGIARTTAQLLWVQIYNLPNSVEWNTTVTDLVTGVVYQNLGVNTNTPASGGTVRPYVSVRTGATTTAATIDVMRSFSKWVAG